MTAPPRIPLPAAVAALAAALLAACNVADGAGSADASGGAALSSGTAAQLNLAAADACLANLRDLSGLVAQLRSAGWDVTPFGGDTEFEVTRQAPDGFGSGFVSLGPDGGCRFGPVGSLGQARAGAASLVERRFPGQYRPGPPEGAAGPCDGYTVFPGRGLVVLGFEGQGNDPVCPDPSGTDIVIDISL
jgi:predicted small secreted protein